MRRTWSGAALAAAMSLMLGGCSWLAGMMIPGPAIDPADRAAVTLMPMPAELDVARGAMPLTAEFGIELEGHRSARLERAVARFRARLAQKTGLALSASATSGLRIEVDGPASDDPLAIDESYSLSVGRRGAELEAATTVGALRGLQTLLQLVSAEGPPAIPRVDIEDRPRFPWRGILIDVCRHWIPKEVLLRNLDAMEAAKLNVLHLHLTEDQAFRIESRVHPKLHRVGSGGDYLSRDDIREIVAEAYDRGIRVVPEFDLPGHSTSWLAAYPELGIHDGPWTPSTRYGIHPVALDPTRDEVYDFIAAFFEEMAVLFPDPVVHIGGDEASPKAWDANERVQAFMKANGLADHVELQAHFNARLAAILTRHGKTMMGWEEIRRGPLDPSAIVHTWLTPASTAESAAAGHRTVVSYGYYMDLKERADSHYANDPQGVPEPVEIPSHVEWEEYRLEIETVIGTLHGSMVLLGAPEPPRGYLVVEGRLIEMADIRETENGFTSEIDSPLGRSSVEFRRSGEDFVGEMGSAAFSASSRATPIARWDDPGAKRPVLRKIVEIPEEAEHLVLGGEAAMWSELVTAETIDSRLWPRTGAVAERLWSPANVVGDAVDMYRRLAPFSDELDSLGIRHRSYREPLLRRIAGTDDVAALTALVSVLHETRGYSRSRHLGEHLTTTLPLEFVADATEPDPVRGRRFDALVDGFFDGTGDVSALRSELRVFRDQHGRLEGLFATAPAVREVEPLSSGLARAAGRALARLDGAAPQSVSDDLRAALHDPAGGARLAIADGLIRLIEDPR